MKTWQFIIDQFESGNEVILLYVLDSTGSSPGRRGFKMAVSSGGELSGTIGGGIMEHKFVELARSQLKSAPGKPGIYLQEHDAISKNRSGMICSGEQTIFLYRISKADIVSIVSLVKSLGSRQNGTLELSMKGISYTELKAEGGSSYFLNQKDDFRYQEQIGYNNILYIIGGGHCSLALSRLLHPMDFYIIVMDEREGLNTMQQNVYADEKIIIPSYEECEKLVKEGNNVYVVIMTFGYRTDDLVVRSLIGKKYHYVGLLGSESKIKKMFGQYSEEDLNPAWLADIHAPIGLKIKSETVEEIAVSIAAEIISIKNRDQ